MSRTLEKTKDKEELAEPLPEPKPVTTRKSKPRRKKRGHLLQVLIELRNHFIATVTLVGLGTVLHFIFKDLLHDPKFFDLIPIRYVVDVGDIAVIATFFITMIKKLLKIGEK